MHHQSRCTGGVGLLTAQTIAFLLSIGTTVRADPAGAFSAVQNPGFETGDLAPWVQDFASDNEGTDWHVTTEDAHSGTHSATNNGNKRLRQNFAAVPSTDVIEISFWLKHPTNTGIIGANVACDLFYSDGTSRESLTVTTTNDWEFFHLTADPGKSLSGFAVWGYTNFGAPGEPATFVDDVTITVIPEPGVVALLLAALPALLLARASRSRASFP